MQPYCFCTSSKHWSYFFLDFLIFCAGTPSKVIFTGLINPSLSNVIYQCMSHDDRVHYHSVDDDDRLYNNHLFREHAVMNDDRHW